MSLGIFVLASILGAINQGIMSVFHITLLIVSGIVFLVYYDKLVRQNPHLKKKFTGRYAYGGIITYTILAIPSLIAVVYLTNKR